jgi:uncharacterized protein DUF3597
MSIFSAILDRLRSHAATASPSGPQPPSGQAAPPSGQQQAQQGGSGQQQGGGSPQASLQNVDVESVLTQMASRKGGGGNWRTSIVDLLKLLDLDSSLDARKRLADELDIHEGAPGTAEENIALHKAVMRKVAENGGKVPESMKH